MHVLEKKLCSRRQSLVIPLLFGNFARINSSSIAMGLNWSKVRFARSQASRFSIWVRILRSEVCSRKLAKNMCQQQRDWRCAWWLVDRLLAEILVIKNGGSYLLTIHHLNLNELLGESRAFWCGCSCLKLSGKRRSEVYSNRSTVEMISMVGPYPGALGEVLASLTFSHLWYLGESFAFPFSNISYEKTSFFEKLQFGWSRLQPSRVPNDLFTFFVRITYGFIT